MSPDQFSDGVEIHEPVHLLVITSEAYLPIARLTVERLRSFKLGTQVRIACLVMWRTLKQRPHLDQSVYVFVEDKGYCATLGKYLDTISCDRVITWIDDRIPISRDEVLQAITAGSRCLGLGLYDGVKLSHGPPYNLGLSGTPFGSCHASSTYIISFTICMWKIGALKMALSGCSTPWDIERMSKLHPHRVRWGLPRLFSVRKTTIHNIHVIIRGRFSRRIPLDSGIASIAATRFRRQSAADSIKEIVYQPLFCFADFLRFGH
jgi:hypothetical protein